MTQPVTTRLDETEQTLCEHIAAQRDAMLRDLAAQVALPTGWNHAPGLDAYRRIVADRLAATGADIEYVDGEPRPEWLRLPFDHAAPDADPPQCLAARHPGTGAGPRILIVGHLDTVHDPEGDFREMHPDATATYATGPGIVDMKGGVLVALTALESLAHLGIDVAWTALFSSDEETGSFCSDSTLHREAAQHDVGLVVEPALPGGALATQRMGAGQFKVEVFGRSAHVGRAFTEGVSAVTALGRILQQVADMADPAEGRIVNVGPLKGGDVTNAVADYAACWGNVRYADESSGAALAGMLDALATDGAALPRVVVQRAWNRPAKPLTAEVESLALRARTVAEDLGQQLPFTSTGGVCDGNILQHAGLPTLDTLGVRGGNLHRTDEFVELASLVERCQLLAVLLARLSMSTPG